MASFCGNDEDLTLPRAAVHKMIKETFPNVRVASEVRELVVNCCTEFIHLISSEANEICHESAKKNISPEHVMRALESLGFGSYMSKVKEVLQDCKTVSLKRRRKASSRLENLGIPEEELLRQQQELFSKARQQQAELAQREWLQMQQAAQQAQLTAASASASNQAGSSQDEDDDDDDAI
ncbi:unnamed protein product [Pipistrellus nathusii]|uniref:Protein Dr1 n=1 Tax=Pipistrellus nathusii TaxID=59473 RepID=A0ABN9ZLC3_PIPNA